MQTPPSGRPELRRSLQLWQLVVTGVGIVIGAGIYVLVGEAAQDTGGLLWLSFVIAGVLAGLTALSYAELAGLFPAAGAEYEFARHAFNEFIAFMAGWMMVAGLIVAAAAVAVGFAHYVQWFVDVDRSIAATGLLLLLTAVVSMGLQHSIWVSVLLVTLQVGGLVLVVAVGIPDIGNETLVSGAGVTGVMSAAALVFFAFIGFDEVATLAEETRDPSRTVPRALLLALGISTLLYVLVGIAAVSSVGADALGSSPQPLGLVLEERVGSAAGDTIALIAIASTTNTTLLVLTAATRMIFSMARGGALPPAFVALTPRTSAPWLAAAAVCGVAVPFALSGQIELIAEVTNFAVFVLFVGVNFAVIRLRRRMPDAPRPFRAPLTVGSTPITAVLGVLTSVLLLFYIQPAAWLLGAIMVALGVGAWLVGPYVGRKPSV